MRHLAVIGVVMVCLPGCNLDSSTPQLPPGPFEPRTTSQSRPREPQHQPSDRTALRAQLDAAHAYWNHQGPMTYELTVSLRCFCDPGVPFVSRVTGLAVVRSTGGHRRDGRSWGPSLRTVELLFSEARRAIDGDADEVELEFDSRYRYPTRIKIDEWRGVSDEEVEWVAQVKALR